MAPKAGPLLTMQANDYRLKAAELFVKAKQAVDPEQSAALKQLALSYAALANWLEKGREQSGLPPATSGEVD